jgi:hypothetical protein
VERREGEFRRQAGAQTREAVRQPGLRHLSELGSTARSRVENIRQVTWCQRQPGRSLRRRPSHQPSGAPLTLPWAREVSPGRGGGSRPGGEGWHKHPEPVAGSQGGMRAHAVVMPSPALDARPPRARRRHAAGTTRSAYMDTVTVSTGLRCSLRTLTLFSRTTARERPQETLITSDQSRPVRSRTIRTMTITPTTPLGA